MEATFKGVYKGIEFEYTPNSETRECNGILVVKHPNGVESTHVIENWHYTRIFQYIESMENLD